MVISNVTSTMKGADSDLREGCELLLPVAGQEGERGNIASSGEPADGEQVEEGHEESDDEERVGFAGWPVWAKCALWLSGSSALGYAVSALVHSAIMVALSIVVVHGAGGIGGPNTLVGFNDGIGIDLGGGGTDDGLDTRLEMDGAAAPLAIETQAIQTLTPQAMAQNTIPALNSIPQLGAVALSNDAAGGTGAKGGAKGKGGGKGAGLPSGIQGFGMPGGGKAVVKGNFTAWTVPEDPKPYESYLIVVQVNLPRRFTTLPEGDVTGSVVGTDHYHLSINDYTSTYFPKSKQVVVRIPGAERRVRDTIHVQSKILNEKQELKIEF